MQKRRLTTGVVATIIAIALVFLAPALATLRVDYAWYGALGHLEVLTTPLLVRVALGVGVGLAVLAALQLNLRLAMRLSARNTPLLIGIPEQETVDVGQAASRLITPASLIVAVLSGLAASGAWREWLMFTHAVPFGEVDPVFGRDVAFYVFTVPLLDVVFGSLLVLSFLCLGLTAGLYVARGGLVLDGPRSHVAQGARLHLGILGGVVFAVLAFGAWLASAEIVLSQDGLVAGAGYTDVHASLPMIRAQMALAAVAAVAVAVGMWRGLRTPPVVAIVLYALVTLVGRGAYPGMIQTWVVEPNELEREREYLEHEIRATRSAYGITDAGERELDGNPTLSFADVETNHETIDNIRLWDHRPLLATFRQIQEIRTYYEFGSVDNDRYMVDGELRQTMLSPRELKSDSLPNGTWINEHFTFTHGYGITLGPVNQATDEGLPVLYVQDIPPASTVDGIEVTRPGIYYGEETTSYAFVRTNHAEFDHPSADGNVITEYDGRGGMELGDSLLRAALAMHLGNVKILLSDDIRSESRILLRREIHERVQRVAPFVRLDHDPYLVVREDGTLSWIFDAYTVTDRFPYARRTAFRRTRHSRGQRVNYVRNSVKVVIDAYDGSIDLYAADESDPILRVWRAVFPELVRPLSELPEDLRAHLRYPLDIFSVQSEIMRVYHLDDADLLYNREDEWQIPIGRPGGDGDGPATMEPYYTVMRVPGEESAEFILMLPFTPKDKANLAAWMVARSDGDHLGELIVYKFPNDRLVFGPQQVLNRINQDADISAQLSLWDQRGSEARLGTLLVIPIEESLIYVLPLYLRSEGGQQIPQLKRVIVAYQNQIAMAPTLDAAVARVFGAATDEPRADSDGQPVAAAEPTDLGDLSLDTRVRAMELFRRAVAAQREGDWAGYGRELEELERTLETLQPDAAPDDAAPDGAAPDGAAPDGAAPDGAAPDGAAPDDAAPDGAPLRDDRVSVEEEAEPAE